MNAMPLDAPPPVRWGDDLIRVYRERYRDLVRLAYLLTRQAAIAEEIVQDAFVASHGKCDTVRDPYAYVRAAVVNRCYSPGRRLKLERERRPGAPDPARLVASSEKIQRELGWQPQFQQIDAIIESAWRWHLRYPHGYGAL